MKKSKLILPILMALCANTVIAGDKSDDLPHSQLKSCMKSQGRADQPKKSIRITSPDGDDFTPEKRDDEKEFDTIPVPGLKESNIEDRHRTRATLLTLLEVPDSEWEFGISTLRYVLGLSTEISERHEHWAINSFRETGLLLKALKVYLQKATPHQEALFGFDYWAYRERVEAQLRLTRYYEALAGHLFFDDHMDSDDPFLPAAQRRPLIKFKRAGLPTAVFEGMTSRSDESDKLLSKIIRDGRLGDEEKRKSLYKHLKKCLLKDEIPQVLYRDLTEEDEFILNRFVIAMKERLLRFITPQEEDLIELYIETYGNEISSESESDWEDASDSEDDGRKSAESNSDFDA